MEEVKRHPFVTSNPTLRPTIINVIRFFNDLQSSSDLLNIPKTPDFALPRFPHEILFAIGGWSNGAPQSFIEAYDSRSDRWNRVHNEDPIGHRAYHGTIAINQTLFCIGGFNGTEYFNTCSKYDLEIRKWKEIAPMHSRRCYVSVAEINGIIYALGGYDGQTRLRTVEKYTPSTNQWTFVAPMHFQRSDADACSSDGKIYICGGFNGHECLNTAEYYTPEIDQWTLLPPMSIRRSGVSCVSYDGKIYVIGGFNGTHRMSSGEKFDLKQGGHWTSIANMFYPRSNFGLEIIDDGIMAVGGYNGTMTIKHCEVYNPEKNDWLHATDMGIIRSALTVTAVKGLVNKKDFVYQNREELFSERCRHFHNGRPFSDGSNALTQTISLPQAPAINVGPDDDEEDDFEEEFIDEDEEIEFDLEL
jgi:kelch-like protein 10